MYLKPIAGRQVPDPDRGDTLPPEGREVPPTQYWQRRLIDGDAVEVSPAAASASPIASAAAPISPAAPGSSEE
jgi:hypothetical protein